MGLSSVLCARLVRCSHPDLPRRDDPQRCFDARRTGRRTRARARHRGRSARRDRRRLVAVLDRPQERRQRAGPTGQGAGEPQGPRLLGRPRSLPRTHDRRRPVRPGDALRRQRDHGALQPSLPPLPPLVGPGRNPLVGLHVHVGLQGREHALRLSARLARDLLAHHLRRSGSDLPRRPAAEESSSRAPTQPSSARSLRPGRALPDPASSGSARGTRLRLRRSRARQTHGRGCKRKERQHTAHVAGGPLPGSRTKQARRGKRSRRGDRLPAVPVALAVRVDRRGRTRAHGCGKHRGGRCQRRSSCRGRRHDRRRRAGCGIRLVVAAGDRCASPPLGGIHRRRRRSSSFIRSSGTSPLPGPSR